MLLRLLCDENLPAGVIAALTSWGMDVVSVHPGATDAAIAEQAKFQARILLTFDSDFANVLAFPPSEFFGIIRLKINPPLVSVVTHALRRVFEAFPSQELFRGKLIIALPSTFRIWEEPHASRPPTETEA